MLEAVRRYATTDLAYQMSGETDEAVAKMCLDVQANDVEAAAEEILADPEAAEVIDQASAQLCAAGAGKLPPGQLFVMLLIWFVCIGAVAAPELPDVPAKLDLPIVLVPAYLTLALALQWRIQDTFSGASRTGASAERPDSQTSDQRIWFCLAICACCAARMVDAADSFRPDPAGRIDAPSGAARRGCSRRVPGPPCRRGRGPRCPRRRNCLAYLFRPGPSPHEDSGRRGSRARGASRPHPRRPRRHAAGGPAGRRGAGPWPHSTSGRDRGQSSGATVRPHRGVVPYHPWGRADRRPLLHRERGRQPPGRPGHDGRALRQRTGRRPVRLRSGIP